MNAEQLWNERRLAALHHLYDPNPAPLIVPKRDGLYAEAVRIIGGDSPATVLEFGVAGGRSIIELTRLFQSPDTQFYGFDSFLGLPEAWQFMAKGHFSTDGEVPLLKDERVMFVKGWFQETVQPALRSMRERLARTPVFVHFDADLYGSTLFLLTSLWPECASYHFVMDDFMVDDITALNDFAAAYPVEIEFLARREGGLPHAILGYMRRVAFRAG